MVFSVIELEIFCMVEYYYFIRVIVGNVYVKVIVFIDIF